MLVIEAATLSYRASYRRVPKNLSKSLNPKVPIKMPPFCCPKRWQASFVVLFL